MRSSGSSALEGGRKQEEGKSVCTCLRGPNTARMGAVCASPIEHRGGKSQPEQQYELGDIERGTCESASY